jgi:hypothetical protein
MILHLAIGGASLFGADRVSLLRFSRTFDDVPSRNARVSIRRNRYPFRRARARSNGMPARPYIVRLISFNRLT